MSKCPGLLSANRHGCVAGWITRWPFHLRNHNLNPAGSHQRINGQRHSYFKVTKHYKKGKGGTFIFLNHGFGHRFNRLPWLCYYTPEPGSRTDSLPALAFPIPESGTGPGLLQEGRSLTSQCVEQQPAAERGMADSMEHAQHELKLLAEMPARTQGALNYSFERNLNVSYCSFTSNHDCIFKYKQINEAIYGASLTPPPNFVYYQHRMNKEV